MKQAFPIPTKIVKGFPKTSIIQLTLPFPFSIKICHYGYHFEKIHPRTVFYKTF